MSADQDARTAFPPSHAEVVAVRSPKVWVRIDGAWRRGRIMHWWRWDGRWAVLLEHEAPDGGPPLRVAYEYDAKTIRPAADGRPSW